MFTSVFSEVLAYFGSAMADFFVPFLVGWFFLMVVVFPGVFFYKVITRGGRLLEKVLTS